MNQELIRKKSGIFRGPTNVYFSAFRKCADILFAAVLNHDLYLLPRCDFQQILDILTNMNDFHNGTGDTWSFSFTRR